MELQALCDKVELFPLSQQLFLHLHQQSDGLGANSIPPYMLMMMIVGGRRNPQNPFFFSKLIHLGSKLLVGLQKKVTVTDDSTTKLTLTLSAILQAKKVTSIQPKLAKSRASVFRFPKGISSHLENLTRRHSTGTARLPLEGILIRGRFLRNSSLFDQKDARFRSFIMAIQISNRNCIPSK